MSQTTFDPTTPGGSSDDTAERTNVTQGAQGATTPHGQNTRHRSTRRGRAGAAAKSAAEAAPAQPAAEHELAAAEAPASAEEPRGGRRGARGGAAKRPAPRGKTGARLIITKAPEEPQAAEATEAPEAPAALGTLEAVAASEPEAPATEPVVVPVVSEQPATPRKTRFGLPRRLQQLAQQPTPAPAPAAEVAAPSEPLASEIAEVAAPAEEAAPAPRYRFDRSRRASVVSGGAAVRPERLASQRAGLYTSGETVAEPDAETPAEPTPATTPDQLFDLPSLDALVGPAGADLPTLAFEAPATAERATADEARDAEQPEEGAEAAEADGTAASSRRRRRRRRGSSHNGVHGGDLDESLDDLSQFAPADDALDLLETAEPEAPAAPSEPSYQEQPQEQPPAPRGRSSRFSYPGRTPRRTPTEPAWDATPQQAAQSAAQQPAAEASPYSSPEPAFARGFGPTPSGVASPVRESYPRTTRVERGVDPVAAAVAQVGSVIREAIGAQTDRLLTEMRHQQPPAVTVSIPNATTAERVGVFVDVANVVYSLRGLRYSVDFGRMLDFLRANRRLARAQAYAPTNPEPGADQSFLNAVKGMGYRITTKNYKTFSNGAKKADLDLDLCMDIVRLVEARAVDTIVLVSGDSDFLPLLDFCYDHGVRVEVAAFDDAASMILRQSCDLFINLSLVDAIRG